MRRLPSLVALLVAALACSGLALALAVELRGAVPERAPVDAVREAAAERATARQERFRSSDRSFDAAYDPRMVRERVQWRAAGTPPTLDLALVNATPGADLVATARACAAAAGAPARRVQCYVFARSEAYDYKDISGDLQLAEPTAIVNLCWATLARNHRAGAAVTVSDMRDAPQTWQAQGCPDAWRGTDQGAGA